MTLALAYIKRKMYFCKRYGGVSFFVPGITFSFPTLPRVRRVASLFLPESLKKVLLLVAILGASSSA